MISAIEIGINPLAFRLGPIAVGWYGIFVALAVVTMVSWCLFHLKKESTLTYDNIISLALIAIISGVIGARLLHVIDLLDYYIENPGKIIGGSGLSIWGAVLGATVGLWIYSLATKRHFGRLADIIAPGIILSQAVGRIGCTILGDDTGTATSLLWGVIYTHPDSPTNQAVGLAVTQPMVTYEIIFNLIVFGVLLMLRNRLKPDGSLFLVYFAIYSVWRIAGDFMRVGTDFLFGLHQAQFISAIVLIISVTLLIWRRTRWVHPEVEIVVEKTG